MSDYATPDVLVSPAWAQRHLDDAYVRFIEVEADTGSHEQGLLPGGRRQGLDQAALRRHPTRHREQPGSAVGVPIEDPSALAA